MPIKLKPKNNLPLLYCYIEPFVIHQNIFEKKAEDTELQFKDKVPLNEIVNYFAVQAKNYEIKLDSNSYNMSKGYVDEVIEYARINYGLNEIHIEAVKR